MKRFLWFFHFTVHFPAVKDHGKFAATSQSLRILDLRKSELGLTGKKTKGACMVHEKLSFRVIGCCMAVHNSLGAGLLEQCYHNALFYELKAAGLQVGYNVSFMVKYRERVVGE